jgi:hypothetical protein
MSVSHIGGNYCMHRLISSKQLAFHQQNVYVPSIFKTKSVLAANRVVGRKGFRTVLMQIQVSWDGTTCRLINSYRLFEERSAFLNCFILKIMARNPFRAPVTSL